MLRCFMFVLLVLLATIGTACRAQAPTSIPAVVTQTLMTRTSPTPTATPTSGATPAPAVTPAATAIPGPTIIRPTSTATSVPTVAPTATATSTPTSLPAATPTATPTPSSSSTTQRLARVAFWSDRDGNFEIYVMDADGSNLTRLTKHSTVGNDQVDNGYPSWSPDGGKMVFCNFTGDIVSMDVMDADGSNLTRLTQLTRNYWDSALFSDCSPAWSPDSAKMAFTSRRDGNVEIFVIDADGSNETRLTDNPADDVDPQWSPDGSKIVFSSGSGACETDFKDSPAGPSYVPPGTTPGDQAGFRS